MATTIADLEVLVRANTKGLQQAERALRAVQRPTERATRATQRFERQNNKLQRELRQTARQTNQLRSALSRLRGPLLTLLSALSGAALLRGISNLNRELVVLSRVTGVGIERLSQMRVLIQRIGLDANNLRDIFLSLADRVSEADEAFADLGLNIRQIQQLSPDEQFLAVADALGDVTNATEQARIAQQIFGEEQAAIVLTLVNRYDSLEAELRDVESITREQQRSMERLAGIFGQSAAEFDRLGAALSEAIDLSGLDEVIEFFVVDIPQALGTAIEKVNELDKQFQTFLKTLPERGELAFNLLSIEFLKFADLVLRGLQEIGEAFDKLPPSIRERGPGSEVFPEGGASLRRGLQQQSPFLLADSPFSRELEQKRRAAAVVSEIIRKTEEVLGPRRAPTPPGNIFVRQAQATTPVAALEEDPGLLQRGRNAIDAQIKQLEARNEVLREEIRLKTEAAKKQEEQAKAAEKTTGESKEQLKLARELAAAQAKLRVQSGLVSPDPMGRLGTPFGAAGEERRRALEQELEDRRAQIQEIVGFAERGFARVGDELARAFVRGEDAALSFQSAMLSILVEIQSAIFRNIGDALAKSLTGGRKGGGIGSILGPIFGAVTSGFGGGSSVPAFGAGTVRFRGQQGAAFQVPGAEGGGDRTLVQLLAEAGEQVVVIPNRQKDRERVLAQLTSGGGFFGGAGGGFLSNFTDLNRRVREATSGGGTTRGFFSGMPAFAKRVTDAVGPTQTAGATPAVASTRRAGRGFFSFAPRAFRERVASAVGASQAAATPPVAAPQTPRMQSGGVINIGGAAGGPLSNVLPNLVLPPTPPSVDFSTVNRVTNDNSQTTVIIDVRGSNGDEAVRQAVMRGIAQAAPQIVNASIDAVRDSNARNLR